MLTSSYPSLADEKFPAYANNFMKHVQKQMGVKVFMMIGYPNKDGDIVCAKFVVHVLFSEC
jgi:hypothetical protein